MNRYRDKYYDIFTKNSKKIENIIDNGINNGQKSFDLQDLF